jgi:hypothetical protein
MKIDIKDVFYLSLEDEVLTVLTISGDVVRKEIKLKDFFKALFPTLDYREHKEEVIAELGEIQREMDKKLRQIYGEYFILRETTALDIREDLKVELSQVLRDSLNKPKTK